MTTYNTGNPLGSVDVRDLYDNAENLDKFTNGPLDAYPDRFGVSRQSLAGMEAEFDADQVYRAAQWSAFLLASGYQVLGPYAAGLVFTSYNQVFSYLGEFYAPGQSIALPYTTSGAGAGEIANFRHVGEAILRSDLANDTDPAKGAALVGYKGRTVADNLGDTVSIKDYGVIGDGSDSTVKIQQAMNETAAAGKTLFFPAGTYIASDLRTSTNLKMVGEHYATTTIKLKDNANTSLIRHSALATGDDYMFISGFTFDGNSPNNLASSPACLVLIGIRTTFTDCIVKQPAGDGVVTDWILAPIPDYGGLTGGQGYFERITIAQSQKTGWIHNGPSDSYFNCIDFLNCGIIPGGGTIFPSFQINSNGRFSNIHPSSGSVFPLTTGVGVVVASNGSTFTNCHFESGFACLLVSGNGNVFENCAYYAPRGPHCIDLAGVGNRITGVAGLAAGYNPTFKGVLLRGANNHIDLTDTGCFAGAVDFTASQGGNIVRISGYHDKGVPYVGTPYVTDDVLVSLGGPGGGELVQQLLAPLTSYSPIVTPAAGAIISYVATGKYRKVGKLTELYLDITITNNGTGIAALLVSLPAPPVVQGFLAGQEQAISGVSLCARLQPGNANLTLTNYANAYPGGTGARFLISGSYITVG